MSQVDMAELRFLARESWNGSNAPGRCVAAKTSVILTEEEGPPGTVEKSKSRGFARQRREMRAAQLIAPPLAEKAEPLASMRSDRLRRGPSTSLRMTGWATLNFLDPGS